MIVLENICKYYDISNVCALNNINLKINQGEYVSIVGSSGSGKSTLMNILGCMDTPTSGKYIFDNVSVGDMNKKQLTQIRANKIGFVFQAFRLSSDLNATDNVALPLMFRGVPKAERTQRAQKALQRVGLAERMNHRPSMLSGGQQQRVAIARAVCTECELLLADEPTGNLDPNATKEIMRLFDTLHDSGTTIVLITHDFSVAKRAQRCISIENGIIID